MAGIRIRHVKLPVTDLPRSVTWYRDLLGLDLAAEFSEAGALRGAQLMHPSGWGIALREREHCASKPDLTGFDAFAFELDSVDELHALAARAAELGYEHTEVVDRGAYGAFLDVVDPDGTVVRFLAHNPLHAGRFVGVDSDSSGGFTLYDTPKLGSRTSCVVGESDTGEQ
ncbi:VOC family protein [Nocardia sp. 2]|uniref:VOC family protein n=1 Tax=Nocardia acididurans TaxID=2802282 RepID=A0ABS1M765_9NOCA|nr:VOC family protein [Nocardia acididurans]MBL1075985.1 VOC family protein [Nocardia acididurans]